MKQNDITVIDSVPLSAEREELEQAEIVAWGLAGLAVLVFLGFVWLAVWGFWGIVEAIG